MNDQDQELDQALALIQEAVQERKPLNRYHARAVLLPLGARLAGADAAGAQAATRRLLALVRPVQETWRQAVQEEMEMAVTEFVKSVDRRYLSRPDYDVRYTREARERLAERLLALQALELRLAPEWDRDLRQADREWTRHLERARSPGDAGGG